MSLLSPLKDPLLRLAATAESVVAGVVALFVEQNLPWTNVTRSQILAGITFLGVTSVHAVRAHHLDKLIAGYIKTVLGPMERTLGPTVVGDVVKELTEMVDKVDALLAHQAPRSTRAAPAPKGGATS